MSQMKDIESQILRHLEKLKTKKTLKFHLKLNFDNFQERKNEEVLGGLLQHSH